MRILFLMIAWLSAILLIVPPLLYRCMFPEVPAGAVSDISAMPSAMVMDTEMAGQKSAPNEALAEETETEAVMQTQTPTSAVQVSTSSISSEKKAADVTAERSEQPVIPTSDGYDIRTRLSVTSEDGTYTVSLREYLIGVVMAEMPASFHKEALRAQAVAARSYLLYRVDCGYSIFDYGSSCTAHFSDVEGRAFFGDAYEEVLDIVTAAVDDTDGEVLYYNGKIICAAYHAMSYGCTAEGKEVWGGDTPYLSSVATPEPESLSGVITAARFEESELCRLLNVAQALPLSLIRSDTGRVTSVVTASGETFSGERFRSLLRLRSTGISVTVQNKSRIELRVSGFGHGVGMSQYGADIYADAGWSYRDILLHYYPMTVIGSLT